jgi:hypothetical protein
MQQDKRNKRNTAFQITQQLFRRRAYLSTRKGILLGKLAVVQLVKDFSTNFIIQSFGRFETDESSKRRNTLSGQAYPEERSPKCL